MKYEQKALLHLKKDKKLHKIIDSVSLFPIAPSEDIFIDLIEAIINQQLSGKAAKTIFVRFKKLFKRNQISPKDVISLPDDIIRTSGISRGKVAYVKNLSRAIVSGDLLLENLNTLSDEEVLTELTKIKGIGRWTAEMILMFSLNRTDVFSLGDLGLRSAVSKLYGIEKDNLREIEKLSLTWSPYRSLAARYLWKSLEIKS